LYKKKCINIRDNLYHQYEYQTDVYSTLKR